MMDTVERSSAEGVDQVYDGFNSYSHTADDRQQVRAGLI